MPEATIDALSVSRTYDRFARFYDLAFGAVLHNGRKTLARVLNSKSGDRILEIGVGSGLMLPLYPSDVQVLGIDISEKMLQRARSTVSRHNLQNICLKLLNAESADLPVSSFDHVVLPYVYSVTPDPALLMRQVFKLCKPGGSVWILNHFSQSPLWKLLEQPLRPFAESIGFRTDFSYKTYVADQGWQIAAEYKVNLFSLSRLVHIRNGNS